MNIHMMLHSAIQRWKLTEINKTYENRHKAVYAAVSKEYGAVILKLNCDTQQLGEEYRMLHKLNGNGCCKVYAYDAQMGILLEERLIPGTVLREEESLNKRVGVFASIFHEIHYEVDCDTRATSNSVQNHNMPSYMTWLNNIYQFCISNDVDKGLTEKAKMAKDICEEMFAKYPERMMLHGDLHHDNILRKSDGTYSMIDPKGVVGPEILEVGRFVMNEIDTRYTTTAEKHMYEVVQCVSNTLGFPPEDVVKVYFMEVILGNVWSAEDGDEVNAEEIELATHILYTTCH